MELSAEIRKETDPIYQKEVQQAIEMIQFILIQEMINWEQKLYQKLRIFTLQLKN